MKRKDWWLLLLPWIAFPIGYLFRMPVIAVIAFFFLSYSVVASILSYKREVALYRSEYFPPDVPPEVIIGAHRVHFELQELKDEEDETAD